MRKRLFPFFLLCCIVTGHVNAKDIEVVVHRGANALAPENTIASADSALAHGATWVEVDVRTSSDGVLFNLHDPILDRTTNGKGFIADAHSREVMALDAGSWFSPIYANTPPPTIEQMLRHLKGRAKVFFDVKPGTPIQTLVDLVRREGFADDSFFWFANEDMLREFIRLAPEMAIKVNAGDIDRLQYWQAICKPAVVEISPENITSQFRKYCHKHGIKVMAACQENNISQYETVRKQKADMVNLDRPELWEKKNLSIPDPSLYVDPRIGSEGVGRVYIGPCAPFGMAKPSPDSETMPNAGWAKMPERIKGFSQTHVSGTGGGQKYGNILLQPLSSGDTPTTKSVLDANGSILDIPTYLSERTAEEILPAYYSCTYTNGIRTEITSSERSAVYRFTDSDRLWLDAASFLGMDTIANKRETQQRVGSEITIVSDKEICGWSSVRGGWNNGEAYKVFFCLQTDSPFDVLQHDSCTALMEWKHSREIRTCKIGISYVSTDQARRNISTKDFDAQREATLKQWDSMLSRVPYHGNAREERIFYTALYHVLLMPTNKTGENPRQWEGDYWDDYYAIWDTYRTSFPLLMEYYPETAASMVRSLLNIYKYEGFLPDARSGDSNGRTQGGSNAEVVLADAFARSLPGIDYRLALEAMVHDAETAPADDEKEGRGGLKEYNSLGYVPYGIARAGTRTMEYSYDDWCIAQLAKGLGENELYQKYLSRSSNWKNLWRSDYSWQGMQGFILPRDADGQWLDSVVWGKSKVFHPSIPYTPNTKVAPWHIAWWDTFFYEALSAEYSLSVPHDVPGLIALCGGAEKFRQRLDTFFANGHYNVGNEPSFLTPYLYHYIGRADLSSRRIAEIVSENFSDAANGLPGNDDSGAMSAWLVWAMLGKYPALPGGNLSQVTDTNGKPLIADDRYIYFYPVHFTATAEEQPSGETATGNSAAITTPTDEKFSTSRLFLPSEHSAVVGNAAFTLNRQYRKWQVATQWQGDTLQIFCNGCRYNIPRQAVTASHSFCWDSPYRPGKDYTTDGTFLFISLEALKELQLAGVTLYDGITWRVIGQDDRLLHVRADIDNTEMWIATDGDLPWVERTKDNPLNIDWILQR